MPEFANDILSLVGMKKRNCLQSTVKAKLKFLGEVGDWGSESLGKMLAQIWRKIAVCETATGFGRNRGNCTAAFCNM